MVTVCLSSSFSYDLSWCTCAVLDLDVVMSYGFRVLNHTDDL